MKIAGFDFKTYATKKPIMITSDGRFITPRQVADTPSLHACANILLQLTEQRYIVACKQSEDEHQVD